MNRTLAILLAAALAACAHQTSFRCQARGGAAWTEYRSRHFLVDTDAQPERAARLVEMLETLQVLDLKAMVNGEVEVPGRLRVVALADSADFRDLAPSWTGAYYTLGRFGEPTIVLPMSAMAEDPEALAHELAHYLSRYIFPVQPLWFAEGLAEFVQTLAAPRAVPEAALTGSHFVRNAANASMHLAGRIPSNLREWSRAIAPTPAQTLLAWRAGEDRDIPGLNHASAWLLYHWLWNQRTAQLSAFEKRLMDGEMPEAAWLAVFPEYDPGKPKALAALDAALDRYRNGTKFLSFAVEGAADASFVNESLPAAEVHLLLTGIRWRWPDDVEARKSLLDTQMAEVLREDPRNPVAIVHSPDAAHRPDGQKLRAVAEGSPADWRAWFLLGSVVEGAEKEAALRKAVRLNPDNALANNGLAWLLARSGREREALPFANRALDLAPWNPAIIDTLAEVAARLGQCAQALQLEARAVSIRPADKSLHTRQEEVRKLCPAG